jgi:hypothetical protein
MFREEPPTFRVRAAWGLGAAAVALIAFGLMAARVLPHSSDDFPPEPRVVLECKVSCGEGAEAVVKVTAPRGAKNVAVVLVDAAGTTRPLVLDPSARSVTLPFGARRALVALPQTVQLPGGIPLAGQRAVAIFSRTKLSYAAIERASSGRETPQDVLTASFPL